MGVGCGCGCCCRGLVWHEHWVSRAVIRWITVDNEGFQFLSCCGWPAHFLFVFLPMSLFGCHGVFLWVEFVFVWRYVGWLVVGWLVSVLWWLVGVSWVFFLDIYYCYCISAFVVGVVDVSLLCCALVALSHGPPRLVGLRMAIALVCHGVASLFGFPCRPAS